MTERTRIAIIGGGASGALAAMNLLRSDSAVRVDLVEPRRIAGTGLAYSTDCAQHLLNVPSRGMSVFPDAPNDFMEWLGGAGWPADPDGFAPRQMFGRYIADRLEAASRDALPHSVLVRHHAEAMDIEREDESAVIHLTGGRRLEADLVVLALGNFPHAMKSIESAWTPGALDVSDPDSLVALIGSGLTAVDAFIALRSKGHRGVVHMISRRGLVAQAHASTYAPCVPLRWKTATLRELVREIRKRCQQDHADWREVICSLRGVTNELWLGLSPEDQARFFRHVKAYWDVHRHRMAPQIAEMIRQARENGSLRIHAGRIQGIARGEQGLKIDVRLRSQEALHLCVERAVNCTGAEQDYARVDNTLLRSLFRKGWLAPNASGLGVRTNESGAILDWLYALGPMRIGGLVETTAVPEIRVQAAALAAALMAERTAVAA